VPWVVWGTTARLPSLEEKGLEDKIVAGLEYARCHVFFSSPPDTRTLISQLTLRRRFGFIVPVAI